MVSTTPSGTKQNSLRSSWRKRTKVVTLWVAVARAGARAAAGATAAAGLPLRSLGEVRAVVGAGAGNAGSEAGAAAEDGGVAGTRTAATAAGAARIAGKNAKLRALVLAHGHPAPAARIVRCLGSLLGMLPSKPPNSLRGRLSRCSKESGRPWPRCRSPPTACGMLRRPTGKKWRGKLKRLRNRRTRTSRKSLRRPKRSCRKKRLRGYERPSSGWTKRSPLG
mmetsp:Transcript_88048/g.247490  ORF Transcript_88048/g.247490 Transcript_88048/m.247490 type:complete len:222 (-) Transcript_88048:333-998(-)